MTSPQQEHHNQMAYRAFQLAHHMRRLSETTAIRQPPNHPNLFVDTSSSASTSSSAFAYIPSTSSSSSSAYSKGEETSQLSTSPESIYSRRLDNPLRTPSATEPFATIPTTGYEGMYPMSTIEKQVENSLYMGDMLVKSTRQPEFSSYNRTSSYPTTETYSYPTLSQSQVPSSLASYNPYGYIAPFPSFSYNPSYQPESYPSTYTSVSGSYQHHGINPQALSHDPSLMSPIAEPSSSSATIFDQPFSHSPTHTLTPQWSPPATAPPRASSLSEYQPPAQQPQPPKLRRHSDSYTSEHYHPRKTTSPAKKGRKRKSGWSVDAGADWEDVVDKKERRKMQNRLAQRAFRARTKAQKG